jgi:hypothetical protein
LCADGGAWRKPQVSASIHSRDAAEIELFYIRTPSLETNGGIYISAGIHGDEAGATEGLITWAEKELAQIWPVCLF